MSNRITIIAEAGVNHNGNLETAKQLIDAAAKAGADYVKFQTFKTENLVSKSAKKAEYQKENVTDEKDNSQFGMLKKLELDVETHQKLIAHCNKKGIKFLSTAFDHDSIDLLVDLNIPFFKIPSGEMTNKPYLKKIAQTKKPVVISTGMATLEEVRASVKVFKDLDYANNMLSVLHCNTQYPTPMEDVNLLAMKTMQHEFDCEIGYSDHTLGIEVPIAAVAMGATIIEKHFTLDRSMPGPDHKASLEPYELKQMVTSIRNIEKALGNGKKTPTKSEQPNISIARKSIHLVKKFSSGHILTGYDLVMKRPATGISPMEFEEVIGKKLKGPKNSEEPLTWEDLE